ncbi:hypothetical protein EB796_023877 [Bugula neritina]|uniref:GST C-terminal domain-containing protein n=1 Tax=Bugula neritina TaxID=10212 RepID=A0A7J7IV91_BUGNE|nr:hypothetical protein EB796_023877 [Bugula neritina]
MLYALAGKPLNDVRVHTPVDWLEIRNDLMGDNLWEEAMNDAIVETCVDSFGYFGAKILRWKVLDFENEPDDSRLLVKNVYKSIERAMEFIQEEAEKRDAKFLTCDRICLADVWLLCSLHQAQLVYTDILKQNDWMNDFVSKVEYDKRIKEYLNTRVSTPI